MVRTVILAAGASSRMGRPKTSLRLGERGETFLSRIIRAVLAAGLPEVVVVGGVHVDAARGLWPAHDHRVRLLANLNWEAGQLSSLVVGLNAPALVPIEAAVVTLVDVPLVTADTMRRLVRAWRETRAPIVRPARGDEHGHPVVFDSRLFAELRRADLPAGAKTVMRAHAADILNLSIDDPGAYLDIDTPEEYARIVP